MNNMIEYIILVVIIAIVYSILLLVYYKMKCTGDVEHGIKSGSAEIPAELIKVIKSISKTGKNDRIELPHKDEYQRILESCIDKNLSDYKINKNSFLDMTNYLKTNIKYRRRCLQVVIKKGQITYIAPNSKATIWKRDGVDNRVFTFVRMITDLDHWCADNNLMLPECAFVIYVADTYAWEETAKDLPWFIMAKPINRPGILIPDNSFITHGISGDTQHVLTDKKSGNWMWDQLIKKSKSLSFDDSKDELYFKGANTGTYKFSTRDYLSKYKWDIPVTINLGSKHESMFNWSKYIGLLNLPGNQPWSYRLKYLYLLKSPVVNIDVLLRYSEPTDTEKLDIDRLDRWIQFFDHLFIPNKDYIQVSQIYYDNPKLPKFNELKKESYDRVIDDIKSSYKKIKTDNMYAENAYKKISNLSTSRMLQFLYVTIVKYADLCNT